MDAAALQYGMRILFNVVGSLAVVLAILGIFLPLLPTTPFLLLASACYLRGSTRMHQWLLNNPVFGKYLHDIQTGSGLALRTRLIALAVMWASLGYSIYLVPLVAIKAILAIIGVLVSLYIMIRLRRPPQSRGKP